MEWNRSETLALATQSCTQCHGSGLRAVRGTAPAPCNCVFRAIFRACYEKFQACANRDPKVCRARLERIGTGPQGRLVWGRKEEEYMADFSNIAKRSLNDEELRMFRFHFLLGADWKLCCRKLNIDRGNFFHIIYKIQEKLGRVFRELEPYALFPLDEYFNGSTRSEPVTPSSFHKRVDLKRLANPSISTRVPLKKAA